MPNRSSARTLEVIGCYGLGLLLLLGLSACKGSPETPAEGSSTPRLGDVVLITVDTLRADHMGVYGYARPTTPNIDRFFEQGAVVRRAYATEANTSPSVVSILSGLMPQQHRVRLLYQLLSDDVRLIPDLLPQAYQSAGFVSNVVLTDEALGIASHFDHFDDFIAEDAGESDALVFERRARATTDSVLRWLKTRRDPERPLFLWVHYIDPHAPYRPPERVDPPFRHAGEVSLEGVYLSGSVAQADVDDALHYVDRYDEEIAYMDSQVERLLSGYAASTPIDDALVIFTADHGESMTEHELWFAHGYHVYDEIVRVPLLLRGPGVKRGAISGLSSGIDIAPTILAFAGADLGEGLDGVDLRALSAIDPHRRVFSEATSPLAVLFPDETAEAIGYWRSVIEGDDKWMVGLARGSREVMQHRRYDLARDPLELEPKQRAPEAAEADAIHELIRLISEDPDPGGVPADLKPGIQLDAPKVAPRATSEQRERLRALGYVE